MTISESNPNPINPEVYHQQIIAQAKFGTTQFHGLIDKMQRITRQRLFKDFARIDDPNEPRISSGIWKFEELNFVSVKNRSTVEKPTEFVLSLLRQYTRAKVTFSEQNTPAQQWKYRLMRQFNLTNDDIERFRETPNEDVDNQHWLECAVMSMYFPLYQGHINCTLETSEKSQGIPIDVEISFPLSKKEYSENIFNALIVLKGIRAQFEARTNQKHWRNPAIMNQRKMLEVLNKAPLTSLVAAEIILLALSQNEHVSFEGLSNVIRL